jgi:hypothetical protein
MARSLPTAVITAVNKQTTTSIFLVLLEVYHPDIGTYYFVNNTENVVAGANTYLAFPFSVTLPPDDPELQVRARLTLSNVTTELAVLRSIAGQRTRATFALKVIEASDPTTVLQSVSGLVAASVSYNADLMDIDLTIDNFLTEPFPSATFSPSTFPGIF